MKKIAFISRHKMIMQGLEARLKIRPNPELELLPLIPPQTASVDVSIHRPDVVAVDLTGELDREQLLQFCMDVRRSQPAVRLLLLLPEEREACCTLAVEAKRNGVVDDFVFYNNTMDYLLAKLAAL